MKAKRAQRRIHPRTVGEAEQLRNFAIDKIDFEAAAAYQEDLEGIALLDREGLLGDVATRYFKKQSGLADSLEQDRTWFDEQTSAEMAIARRQFDASFRDLERSQNDELNKVFTEWREARQKIQSRADGDLKTQLEVAKELARRCKFKEASDTRDKAFHQKTVQLSQSSAEVDAHYDNLINLMLTRHQTALDSFVRERQLELATHETLNNGVKTRTSEAFAIDNAATVFKLAREKTTAGVQMPLSFAYQTVHAREEERPASPAEHLEPDSRRKRSKTLTQGFAPLAQTVLTPCPLRKSKSPITRDLDEQKRQEETEKQTKFGELLGTPRGRRMPATNIFLKYATGETPETTELRPTPAAVKSRKLVAKPSPSVETSRRL
jgi:hypothetical protein